MDFSQFYFPFTLTVIAGLSTVLGSLIFLSHKISKKQNLGFFLGLSAGVMIYLSFVELLPYSVKHIGYINSQLYFFIGILSMAILDYFLPHDYLKNKLCCNENIVDHKLLSMGFVVSLGLIIHNIPEGAAVFLSSITSSKMGILLAIAISIHNIPEGIAVAAPIYYATLNKRKAIQYAFIAGLAEPFGAIVAYVLLKPYLGIGVLSYTFALVAGIMVYISFDELLPSCFKNNQDHRAIFGIIVGMIIVAVSLIFL